MYQNDELDQAFIERAALPGQRVLRAGGHASRGMSAPSGFAGSIGNTPLVHLHG
jgi:hypothetical protein